MCLFSKRKPARRVAPKLRAIKAKAKLEPSCRQNEVRPIKGRPSRAARRYEGTPENLMRSAPANQTSLEGGRGPLKAAREGALAVADSDAATVDVSRLLAPDRVCAGHRFAIGLAG